MKKYSIYLLSMMMTVGCAQELTEPGDRTSREDSAPEFVSTKAVNTSANAIEGMILINLEEKGSSAGLSFESLKNASIEPAFKVTPKNAEKLAAIGLDRWYVVHFDKSVSLYDAAKVMDANENVKSFSFNKRMARSYESKAVAYSSSALPALTDPAFNDPMLVDQWHYENLGSTSLAPTVKAGADINVKDAWRLTAGDPSIVVAVVDEGVQYNHPDLEANMWTNTDEIPGDGKDNDGNGYIDDYYGYNFTDDGSITWAKEGDSGHGTHVAGTVAAVNNNGTGVSGVAGGTGNGDGVRIMSCQVMSGESGGGMLDMARAFVYAADNGAHIAQCSFGYESAIATSDAEYNYYCPIEVWAINYFLENGGGGEDSVIDGGIIIFAAGNETDDMAHYPGAYRDCISVTAIGPDYLPTAYTNYGPGSNIAAPGGETGLNAEGRTGVLSTLPAEIANGSEYGYFQGTSMAAPHVSGVAALGLSYAKKLGKTFTREEFTNLLLTSVNDLEAQLDREKSGMKLYNYHGGMGTGLVDAWKLLMQIEGTPCVSATIGKASAISLKPYFGGSSDNLTFVGLEIPDETKTALGIVGEPEFAYGKLVLTCTKAGSGKITVTAITDYKGVYQGQPVDPTYVTREISLIARGASASNGGWL